jgi:hypothetical protein
LITSVSPSGCTQTDPATPACLAAAISLSTGSSMGSCDPEPQKSKKTSNFIEFYENQQRSMV